MASADFLDTNVLVYAYDPRDARKHRTAQGILDRAMSEGGVISVQVLAELTSTLLHKSSPRVKPAVVLGILEALSYFSVVVPDLQLVSRALEAHVQYGIHFYDGMIVAAAERAGCHRIWSEDLNPGQTYFGVTVENPFD